MGIFDWLFGKEKSTNEDEYAIILLKLSSRIIGSEKKFKLSELNYVNTYFEKKFGYDKANYYFKKFNKSNKDHLNEDLQSQCFKLEKIRSKEPWHFNWNDLILFLFRVAAKDNNVQKSELILIKEIVKYSPLSEWIITDCMNIISENFQGTTSEFYTQQHKQRLESACEILGLTKELKSRVVSGWDYNLQQVQDETQQVSQAYVKISEEFNSKKLNDDNDSDKKLKKIQDAYDLLEKHISKKINIKIN
tara:strand:- start:239 stop:982 length:744 start_codon:yes stop_codon:yes gene_type:complete